MTTIKLNTSIKIIHEIIEQNHFIPNNPHLPFLIYKNALTLTNATTQELQKYLEDNGWINSWVDGIYDVNHYHSNTPEVLVVFSGTCKVQIGGRENKIYEVNEGDVLIIPPGVAHKSMGSSSQFKCIGAYPLELKYDMNYGLADEHPKVDNNIKQVKLPVKDPVFGKDGPLFKYWK